MATCGEIGTTTLAPLQKPKKVGHLVAVGRHTVAVGDQSKLLMWCGSCGRCPDESRSEGEDPEVRVTSVALVRYI